MLICDIGNICADWSSADSEVLQKEIYFIFILVKNTKFVRKI